MDITSLEDFYRETASVLPEGINKEIGHFNVFKIADVMAAQKKKPGSMPYNRRAYYKISLVSGRNKAEYADKIIDIDKNALLFATPRIPYNWLAFLQKSFWSNLKAAWYWMISPFLSPEGILCFNCQTLRRRSYRLSSVRCIRSCHQTMCINTICCAIIYWSWCITDKNYSPQ
jgi:hypothetical protein